MPELLFIIKKNGDDLLNLLSIILEVSQQYSATRRIGISQHVTEDLQESLPRWKGDFPSLLGMCRQGMVRIQYVFLEPKWPMVFVRNWPSKTEAI